MRDLSNYYYNEKDINKIQFDQYGRPYIQDGGQWMLRRKSTFNYSISN